MRSGGTFTHVQWPPPKTFQLCGTMVCRVAAAHDEFLTESFF